MSDCPSNNRDIAGMNIVVLVPAHNEEESVEATVSSLLSQSRLPDLVVVICDNCTDDTEDVASIFTYHPNFRLLRTVDNTHRKSGALNLAYSKFCDDADLIITVDADTILSPTAIENWEREFEADPDLGGSVARFTIRGTDILSRLQRNEYARGIDMGLRRGWTSVLGGAASALRKSVMDRVAALQDGRSGPWTYASLVEDFELTYKIHSFGCRCCISPTVRAYTDSMKTIRSLWGQRMKWQVGTVSELFKVGINKVSLLQWYSQIQGMLVVVIRILWLYLMATAIAAGHLTFNLWWIWILIPVIITANEFKHALRIPHRDRWDLVIVLTVLPVELFSWLRMGWFVAGWWKAVMANITGRQKDWWAMQYQAERGGDR
ncbi:poly-beta-1,6-N-acetyl-D-glucosamine synthase [bacterium BMS3Abin01]|nr:poly-beta-1,6-N-acetyl-D-glucosamine synthase [bacterium BMS3Abin01]HDY69322.1 glycosyltransferase [Actinomycetota bacterium]